MYKFTDTNSKSAGEDTPAEAISINGNPLDTLIDGYRTLYVRGREGLSTEITSQVVGNRAGAIYQQRRYSDRTLTVGYQVITSSNQEYRNVFNTLAGYLNVENAKIVFNDEPDKYFIGTPQAMSDVDPGKNGVVSEFEIYCADPFKYTIVSQALSFSDGTVTVSYSGTIPSHPRFEMTFPGNCSQVAIVDTSGHVLQFSGSFKSGDRLVIDCTDISVMYNNKSAPGLGAIGNAWDTLTLKGGENTLTMTAEGTAPTVVIKFQEVYV